MSDVRMNDDEPANPSKSDEKQKPGTKADEAKAMEEVQKEAAKEREEDGGYQ